MERALALGNELCQGIPRRTKSGHDSSPREDAKLEKENKKGN